MNEETHQEKILTPIFFKNFKSTKWLFLIKEINKKKKQ